MAPPEKQDPHKKKEYIDMMKSFYKTGNAPWVNQINETDMIRPDGKRISIETKSFVIPIEGGVRAGSIIREITKRKEEQKRLEELLKERELLFKEMNHRIKNNLLLVTSLINLKRESADDSTDLSDLELQIETIRLAHDNLYQSEDINDINLKEYVKNILETVFSFSKKSVNLECTIDMPTLPSKTLVPLGLIINEIATNAMKHGFNNNDVPEFSVTAIEETRKGEYVFTLCNSGKPFPPDINLEHPETLGLRLITALVDQIGGTIHLDREPHPVFTIRIPREE